MPLDGLAPPHVDVEDDEGVVDDGFELAPLLRQIALLPRPLLRRLLGETPGEGLCVPLSIAIRLLELRRGPRPSVFSDEPLPSVLARQAGIALEDLHGLFQHASPFVELLLAAGFDVDVAALERRVGLEMLAGFAKKRLPLGERPLLGRDRHDQETRDRHEAGRSSHG